MLNMVRDGIAGGCLHYHLHRLDSCSAGTRAPTIKPPANKQTHLYLVISEFQEFNGWVHEGAVISVKGEQQWRKNTSLRGTRAESSCAGSDVWQVRH